MACRERGGPATAWRAGSDEGCVPVRQLDTYFISVGELSARERSCPEVREPRAYPAFERRPAYRRQRALRADIRPNDERRHGRDETSLSCPAAMNRDVTALLFFRLGVVLLVLVHRIESGARRGHRRGREQPLEGPHNHVRRDTTTGGRTDRLKHALGRLEHQIV